MSYIRKTHDIFISPELSETLSQIADQSLVARLLLCQRHPVENLCKDPVNYISTSKSDRTKISYITQDRLSGVEDPWHSSKRFISRPGSFVSKIFSGIPEKEIEKFATLFRNTQTAPEFTFKVVEGKDISKYYHYESYADQSSSLGASCMKHPSCQEFLGIYVENSDVIKMVIMLDRNQNLVGRALIWNIEPNKIMDRIYTINDDRYTSHFKKWADDNSYLYKREQKWNNTLFFESKGNSTKLELSVKLNKTTHRRYPYLDTFKFLDKENCTLYNYIPTNTNIVTISTADGGTQPCDYLVRDGKTDLFHYYHDTSWVEYRGYRTHANNVFYSEINDAIILKEDAVYNEEISDYIFIDNSFNNMDRINERISLIRKQKEERESRRKPHPISGFSGQLLSGDVFGGLYQDILMSQSRYTIRHRTPNTDETTESNPVPEPAE